MTTRVAFAGSYLLVSKYRKRHLNFAHFFVLSQRHSLCYYSDMFGLFNELDVDYYPLDWHLFIDCSVKSLKAVLLHNGNKFPSILVDHSVHMKKEYKDVEALLAMINCTCHNWKLCGNFKMLSFLLDQQRGVQSIHAFSAYGIAKLMINIIQKSSGLLEKN